MSATVIPFPTPADPAELLELDAHLLELYATRIDELVAERCPEVDPRLSGRMRELADHCDRLAGTAGPHDADVDGALGEASDLLDTALGSITRSSVRRLLGLPLLQQLDEGVLPVSALATVCHLDHVAFEDDGRRIVAQPLDRLLLRRFLRATARGYVFTRERARLDEPHAAILREVLVDGLVAVVDTDEPAATDLCDVFRSLHDAWCSMAAAADLADLERERADATPERGDGAEQVRRAFAVGAGCALARRFVSDAVAIGGGRVPSGVDPVEWLAPLACADEPTSLRA